MVDYCCFMDIKSELNTFSESYSLVGKIEMGVVLLDEGVSKDESVSELRGELKAHDSKSALSLSEGGNLEDVLSGAQDIVSSSNDEGEIGVWVKSGAIDDLGEFGDDGVNNGLGTNDDWGTSVNLTMYLFIYDSLEVWDSEALSSELDVVHIDEPIGGVWEGVVGEFFLGEAFIDSSEDEGWSFLSGFSGQIEGEGVVLDLTLLDEEIKNGGLTSDWDGAEGHTQDSVHLGSGEADSLQGFDETEVNLFSD